MFKLSDLDINNSNVDVNEINKCKEKIKEEKLKIEDAEFNIDVYTDRMISKIRMMIPVLSCKTLHCIWANMRDKKEKDDNKDFNSAYNVLNRIIIEDVIGSTKCSHKKRNIVTEVICCGFGEYGYTIHFFADEIEFIFTIPVPEHINKENYTYADEGKYTLGYYSSKCCTQIFAASYNLNDIQKGFEEFIENNKKEKLNADSIHTGIGEEKRNEND